MSKYSGSIELISGIRQANGGDFPLVDASAIQVDDTGKRLDKALEEIRLSSYPIVETSDSILMPDQFYVFGTVDSLVVTLQDVDDGYTHEYCFEFSTADKFYGMSITPEPKWVDAPAIETNKTYQVSILRGIGVIIGA